MGEKQIILSPRGPIAKKFFAMLSFCIIAHGINGGIAALLPFPQFVVPPLGGYLAKTCREQKSIPPKGGTTNREAVPSCLFRLESE
jgi:hypothetical protein